MELELLRTYFTEGTNGVLTLNGIKICATIELPWKYNIHQHSCIPEKRYSLKRRYTPRFGLHLLVENVAGRDAILVHPANNAMKELKGCIAPVTVVTGEGHGLESRKALEHLMDAIDLCADSEIYLNIKIGR
jgi:hypothetical protein